MILMLTKGTACLTIGKHLNTDFQTVSTKSVTYMMRGPNDHNYDKNNQLVPFINY